MTRKKLLTFGAIVLLVLLVGAFCVGFFRLDYAFGAQQIYNNLNIDAELMDNGSLRITEHWQMKYTKRDTAYWNHSVFISKTKATSVQDFSVYDADYGREYAFKEGATAFSAGERSCYITDNNNWYELGWNFPRIDSGERNFTISYTLTDTVSHYADADELLYAFVSEGNIFPIRRFQLTLRFPNAGGLNDLYAWVHCEGGGEWSLADPRILTLSADKLTAHTPVELRLLLPPGSVEGTSFLSGSNIVEDAIAEEAGYTGGSAVNSLNRYRHFSVLLSILGALAAIATVVLLAVRYERKIKTSLAAEPRLRREIPGCIRPSLANRLYYHENSHGSTDNGESYAFSATTLSLIHKRWLSLSRGKKEGEVFIHTHEKGSSPAEGEELVLLEIYRTLATRTKGPFTLDDLQMYRTTHPTKMDKWLAGYQEAVHWKFGRMGWARPIRFFNSPLGWTGLGCLVLGLGLLLFGGFIGKGILVSGLLLAAALAACYAAFRLRLTEKGLAELMSWRGFTKYLREYSLLCERPAEELSLWGDYLVYATAFGLSKTFAAEISLVFNHLAEEAPALPCLPLQNPFEAYFAWVPDEKKPPDEMVLWPYIPFINQMAKTYRNLRGGPTKNSSSLRGKLNSLLARLKQRFGTR